MKKLSIYKDGNRLVVIIDNPDEDAIERVKCLFEQEVLDISCLDAPPVATKEIVPREIKKVEPINLSTVAQNGQFKGKTIEWIYDNKFGYLVLNIIRKPELLDGFLVTKKDFIKKVDTMAKGSEKSLGNICLMLKNTGAPIDDFITQRGKKNIEEFNSSEKDELILFIGRFLVERRYGLDGTVE